MLGENHSLLNDFPEHKDKIDGLKNSDSDFADQAKRYHELDEQIRKLELRDSPIGDEAMHQLKQDRAELKDSLYQRVLKA